MFFENLKKISYKSYLWPILTLILLVSLLFTIINSIRMDGKTDQDLFAYTVKVRDAVEEIDKIFERAEVNVNVMVDSISNSYDASKQQDKTYNLHFIENIDGLIKSVLSNSPSVDGSWFQINADLPYAASAFNWYEFSDSQFINIKDQFEDSAAINRKITPEDDPYYFDAINTQKPVWSAIYTDADTQKKMMTISAPIYKDGSLVGVVGIDISTRNLQQALAYMQSMINNSELYLLDKKNNVILSQPDIGSSLQNNNYPFLDAFKDNKEGPIEYYDSLTKKTAIMLTLSNDYQLVIAIKNKDLFNHSHQIYYLVSILFILLVISTIMTFFSQFKLNKITELSKIKNDDNTEESEENEDSEKDDNEDFS